MPGFVLVYFEISSKFVDQSALAGTAQLVPSRGLMIALVAAVLARDAVKDSRKFKLFKNLHVVGRGPLWVGDSGPRFIEPAFTDCRARIKGKSRVVV